MKKIANYMKIKVVAATLIEALLEASASVVEDFFLPIGGCSL